MNPDETIHQLRIMLQSARESYERRLLIIIGNIQDTENSCLEFIEKILKLDANISVLATSNYRGFRQKLKEILKNIEHTIISNWETDRVLGKTFDLAVIDLRDWLDVIALSRTIGTVRGGGLILLLLPYDYNTKTYYEMLVPPYFAREPRKILLKRIFKKSINYPGVYILDATKKRFLWKPEEKPKGYTRTTISIPPDTEFPTEIYELAATEDQVMVLKVMESWKSFIILLANRGRGKSSSIGLGLTGYAYNFFKKNKRPLYVCLTSRSKLNVEEVFKFTAKAHKKLGYPYEYNEESGTFKSNILRIEFELPHRAIKLHKIVDALVVDEVAAIPFPVLRRVISFYKQVIFSGTVHGYEGTGRIFAVRFLKLMDDLGIKYTKIELKEPIRYAKGDPIETWLFDILFLDAEPASVNKNILSKLDRATLIEIKPQEYFLGDSKKEKFMRTLIGILTTAHYRNNPKDVLLMCDAPHHRIFALTIDSIPVVAMQVAEEGGVPQSNIQEMLEEAPSGHLIPDNILRYTGFVDFPTFKGLRIVRIATHPDLQGEGLGSLALKKLAERARQEGKFWIGASFGANPLLIRFWIKNNFIVTNLSPIVNPKTGEFSAIVIKPLTKKARSVVIEANRQLKIRLLRELRSLYWELEPETARLMLKSGEPIRMISHLNSGDIFRLGLYLNIGGRLEACIDVIDELTKIYFGQLYDFLKKEEELLLIKKIGQRRLLDKEELPKIRRIIKKLWNKMLKAKFRRE